MLMITIGGDDDVVDDNDNALYLSLISNQP